MSDDPMHSLTPGPEESRDREPLGLREALERAGVVFSGAIPRAETLPFSTGDTTAGSETELHAVVVGRPEDVDLPIQVARSSHYARMITRAAAGDTSRRPLTGLERFLHDNPSQVWENSWAWFPRRVLSTFATGVLEADLLVDKRNPGLGRRSDAGKFEFSHASGEECLRLPVSYLLKLALADCMGASGFLPSLVRRRGRQLMAHFLNDNSSPETFSFFVVPLRPGTGHGRGLAAETGKRFLLTQLLLAYANQHFGLLERGQRAMAYHAPHPPLRQKDLNACISDAFYRELFMSPCLSGWTRGEDKHRYMHLCHQVLSRSQINAVAKLREAGIIVNNLVVLPSLSNVSLANNGTHISLGSRRLSAAMADADSGFGAVHEKLLGDLAIKITEHFLPLFVGTYTAAPYRLAFTDFHPERALGFLPHELDYTHLRMLWRRWRKKARLKIFGQPVTPFGPAWLDEGFSRLFGLKGDFVPDFRLLDYLVCLLSTDHAPALDGRLGNLDRLKRELTELGVFDEQMSVYLLYRLREFAKMGFSGFEGRHYSAYETFADLGRAADLQTLVTALAFKYMGSETVTHGHVPDDPTLESERRQIFFACATGVPTFYVDRASRNAFLGSILELTRGVRPSRRYPGYHRVKVKEFRKALVRVIRRDASDLVEQLGMEDLLRDLEDRLDPAKDRSATARLTRGILEVAGARTPLHLKAQAFNEAAETYYRGPLRLQQTGEALELLAEDLARMEQDGMDEDLREALEALLPGSSASEHLRRAGPALLVSDPEPSELVRLIGLLLLSVEWDSRTAATYLNSENAHVPASVSRAG